MDAAPNDETVRIGLRRREVARPGGRLMRNHSTYYGWYVVAASAFALFLGGGAFQAFGLFVETWEQDFGVGVATISVAASLGVLINGLSQPFLGRLVDRSGGRAVMLPALCVLGVACLAMALITTVYLLIALYGVVIAIAVGGVSPVTTGTVVARWFDRRRGAAMSLLAAGSGAGGLLLIPFLAYLLIATDWQTAWIVLGVVVLALGLPLALLVVRNDPMDLGLRADGDDEVSHAVSRRTVPRGPLQVEAWRDSFRSAPMWQLSLTFVVCGVTTSAIAVHFVRWASDEGISTGTAALAFSLLSGVNAAAVLGVGALSDRVERKRLLGGVYFVRFLAFLALILLPGSTAIWVFAVIGGGSWLATVPLTTALTADFYGLKHLGMLSGMVMMAHQLGGAAAVFLFGLVFDQTGTYDPAFITGAVLLVLASLAAFSIREREYSTRYLTPAAVPRGGD